MHSASRTGRLRTAALAAACAVLTQGCSAIFVRSPARDSATEPPSCTESRAAPMADALLAGVAATFGAAGLTQTLNHCSPSSDCAESFAPGLAVLGGVVLLTAGASAFYGFHQTKRCREAWTSWCGSHDCGDEPDDGTQSVTMMRSMDRSRETAKAVAPR